MIAKSIKTPYLVLLGVEMAILVASVYFAAALRFEEGIRALQTGFGAVWPNALVYSVVMVISLFSMGLYQVQLREGVQGIFYRIVVAYLIGMLFLSFVFYLFPITFLGRGILLISMGGSFFAISLLRFVIYRINPDIFKRRTLVLGAGRKAIPLTRMRRRSDQVGFKLVGFVHVRGEKDEIAKSLIIKLNEPLIDYVNNNHIDEIVVAINDRRKGYPVHELLDCKMNGVNVIDMVSFFERESRKIILSEVRPGWFLQNDGFHKSHFQSYLKRGFDIVVSGIMLLLTWPVMLVTVIAIKAEEGLHAPLIYRQIRVGQNGKPFYVLKFRSMRVDAEKGGRPQWAKKSDARVTRVGKIIRKLRIDELPQIFNVFRGDMSFVGPRPERPEFVVSLGEKLPYYSERHRVKPGITGWAQICYPYGSSETDAFEKLQYDLFYVKNYSLSFDFMILLQTVEVVLFGKGAR